VALMTYWQQQEPVFKHAPKLLSAMRAFAHDLTAKGQPLPATVSLRQLVSGGYIAARDDVAFKGMEVTISLHADEADPQAVLMRARLADGSVVALIADGSVQSFAK
jgi:hypothetical protein